MPTPVEQRLSAPWVEPVAWLLAALIALGYLTFDPSRSPDLDYQLASALHWSQGHGYTMPAPAAGDLANIAYERTGRWPAGYSALAQLGLRAGLDLHTTALLVRGIGMLLLLAAVALALRLCAGVFTPVQRVLIIGILGAVSSVVWHATASELYFYAGLTAGLVACVQALVAPAPRAQFTFGLLAGAALAIGPLFKFVAYATLPVPVALAALWVLTNRAAFRPALRLVAGAYVPIVLVLISLTLMSPGGAGASYVELYFRPQQDLCWAEALTTPPVAFSLVRDQLGRIAPHSPQAAVALGWIWSVLVLAALAALALSPWVNTSNVDSTTRRPAALLATATLITLGGTWAQLVLLNAFACHTFTPVPTYYQIVFPVGMFAVVWAAIQLLQRLRPQLQRGATLALLALLLACVLINARGWVLHLLHPPTAYGTQATVHGPLYAWFTSPTADSLAAGQPRSAVTVTTPVDRSELAAAALAGYAVFRPGLDRVQLSAGQATLFVLIDPTEGSLSTTAERLRRQLGSAVCLTPLGQHALVPGLHVAAFRLHR